MIKESEIVTKTYLAHELGLIRLEMKEQKSDILKKVRIMMHETMMGGMENMKLYYDEQMKHLTGALMEGVRDEMRIYKDSMGMFKEEIDGHEVRITALESSAL